MQNINQEIEKSLREHFPDRHSFALAVSGGPDSQCLLHSFVHVNKKFNHRLIAIGCDHGLRKESRDEISLAESTARELGIEFIRIELNLNKSPNMHAIAREARYGAMRDKMECHGFKTLITAHHYDDRAETVLIRLIREKNLGSLGCLPPISGFIYRPLLTVSRSDIMRHIKRWDIKYATDPSNDDSKYLRARVRNELLPLLKELNPSIVTRLNEISDEALKL